MKCITFFIILEDVWSKVTTLQQSFYIDIDKMKNKSSVQNIWVFLSWLSKVKNIWQKKNCDFFLQLFLIILKKEFYLLISVKIEIEIESILIILFYSYRTGQRAFTMLLEIPLRVGILFNFLKIERMYSLWTWFEI